MVKHGDIEIWDIIAVYHAVGTTDISTTSIGWTDMADMSVTIPTVKAGDKLIVDFDAPIANTTSGYETYTGILLPGEVGPDPKRATLALHAAATQWIPHKISAVIDIAAAATNYLVKIQWKVNGGQALQYGTGQGRRLTVMHLRKI